MNQSAGSVHDDAVESLVDNHYTNPVAGKIGIHIIRVQDDKQINANGISRVSKSTRYLWNNYSHQSTNKTPLDIL